MDLGQATASFPDQVFGVVDLYGRAGQVSLYRGESVAADDEHEGNTYSVVFAILREEVTLPMPTQSKIA